MTSNNHINKANDNYNNILSKIKLNYNIYHSQKRS